MADYSIEVAVPTVGPQGVVGPVGPPNALAIGTVTTGDEGTEATATISGTPPNQTLDLTIPRGDTGLQGTQGNAGPTGAGGLGVVPAEIYATMQAAVEGGITFGGVYRHTSGSVFWVEEPDPDAAAFIASSGATDAWNIQKFVQGVKDLGLWDDMACWPLRSAQNAGNGNTVYSLGGLGTFNGTRVNEPTWGADGIDFVAASITHITTPLDVQNLRKFTAMVAANQTSQVGAADSMMSAWNASTSQNYFILRKTATNVFNALTRSASATRQTSIAGGVVTTGAWLMHGWGTQGAAMVPTINATAGTSVAFLPDETGSSTVSIGILAPPNNAPFNGKIAWAFFYKDNEMTTAQQLSVYNLYKQTLGTGLGLP